MNKKKQKLLFDIGASKMRLALTHNMNSFFAAKVLPTPQKYQQGLKEIKNYLNENAQVVLGGACGGIAGPLNEKRTMLSSAPNIRDWKGRPLVSDLQKLTNGPVILENDTLICGLGEAASGAGKNKRIVVYYTFSTGVNGIKIVDGQAVPSFQGTETGFQIIGEGKTLMNTVSGSAIFKAKNQNPEEIKDKKFWSEVAVYIGRGICNSILHWSPEIVVVGGGVAKSVPLSLIQAEVKRNLKIFKILPKIERASLGDLGGLYGAMVLLKQKNK